MTVNGNAGEKEFEIDIIDFNSSTITRGAKPPVEFYAINGLVEKEIENSILVRNNMHDITDAMVIDEKGDILKEGYLFYGKEVLILYQYDKVISVMIFPTF